MPTRLDLSGSRHVTADLTHIGGVALATGRGIATAGTLRVTVSTDDDVRTNQIYIGGVAIAVGAGVVNTGTQRVTLASDDPVAAATGVHDAVAPTRLMEVGWVAETTVPVAVADGDAVRPWADEYGRQVIKGCDIAQDAVSVSDIAPGIMQTAEQTYTTLTAPGATPAAEVSDYHHHCIQITVANINTNVIIEIQGSNDNANWCAIECEMVAMTGLAWANRQATITANGTRVISAKNIKPKYLRIAFISEDGGTAATLAIIRFSGN